MLPLVEIHYARHFDLVIASAYHKVLTSLYDQLNETELKQIVRTHLLSAFTSPHEEVRRSNFVFFEKSARIEGSISQYIMNLLKEIYDPQYEQLWLKSAVPLLLTQCKKSSDYERMLFEHPLEENA